MSHSACIYLGRVFHTFYLIFNHYSHIMVVDKCFDYKTSFILDGQAVYNANRYAKLVKQKERLQNWLDYYQLKFERHPDKRPTGRVFFKHWFCPFIYLHIKFLQISISYPPSPKEMLQACQFFLVFQSGCFGFCGREVDQIDYYRARISELDKRVGLQSLVLWFLINDRQNAFNFAG